MGNLTALKVKTATTGKYEDGDGLRLVVTPTGAKKWVLRVTTHGKRREMGLGAYPTVSLKTARDKATKARQIVAEGGDPIAAAKVKAPTVPT
ncbi:MAG: Arm DNA-binding domain-containing protein, partial [Chromatiaceae bacterium]